MSQSGLRVTPYSSALGALIEGVDLAQALSEAEFSTIRQAFHDYGVIFFRDQAITPEQHLAFARRWSQIDVNRFFKPVEGYPEIAQVLKEPDQRTNIGGDWHTDHSYDEVPAMGSMLLACEVPPRGGDTLFASMGLAYEALSPGLRVMLDGLRAVHSSAHVFGANAPYVKSSGARLANPEAATQTVVHPVVIRHPQTGRRTLYVNRAFTLHFEGWTPSESKPLLDYLYQHAAQPEFTCRFEWQKGSMAFWDNRATWHYALNDYHGHRRLMHRITLQGSPIAAASTA